MDRDERAAVLSAAAVRDKAPAFSRRMDRLCFPMEPAGTPGRGKRFMGREET